MRRVIRITSLIFLIFGSMPLAIKAEDGIPNEIWSVRHGDAKGTWTIHRTSETSFRADVKIEGLPPFPLLGHMDKSGISGISSYPVNCNITAAWRGKTELVGQARCSGKLQTWNASISSSPDEGDVALLQDGQKLDSTEIFKRQSPSLDSPIYREATTFEGEMRNAIIAAQHHDVNCMKSQFLYVRLQRPSWSYSSVKQKILSTCINTVALIEEATAKCKFIYPERNKNFCDCYALGFTNEYKKNPLDNVDYFTQIGLKVGASCKK